MPSSECSCTGAFTAFSDRVSGSWRTARYLSRLTNGWPRRSTQPNSTRAPGSHSRRMRGKIHHDHVAASRRLFDVLDRRHEIQHRGLDAVQARSIEGARGRVPPPGTEAVLL